MFSGAGGSPWCGAKGPGPADCCSQPQAFRHDQGWSVFHRFEDKLLSSVLGTPLSDIFVMGSGAMCTQYWENIAICSRYTIFLRA